MKLTAGDKAPEQVNVLIEIPSGSSIKYELDKETDTIFVDRFLHTAMFYPFNYGFIPGTMAPDGDPVDVIVLSEQPIMPGCAIKAFPIGFLEMEDEEGVDAKVVAVPTLKIDPFYGTFTNIDQIPEAMRNKIKHFFENYKTLEPGKWIKIKDWKGKEEAVEEVRKGMK